jgi:hypothetical protein
MLDLALTDLEAGTDVLPTMVAFDGDQPLFLATLRPFLKGDYHDPVIEISSLASCLGADRLLLSLSGRAWSTQDPIPPVLGEGADLRQRVITLHAADAYRRPVAVRTTIVPFDIDPYDGSVSTGQTISDLGGEGFIPLALRAAVADPQSSVEEVGLQMMRCEALGHRIAWSRQIAPFVRRLATRQDQQVRN